MSVPAKPESDSGRWRRIESLCHAALDLAPQDRRAFLAAACAGDDVLLREVEALLAHERTAGAFLAAPLGAVAADVMSAGSGQSLVGRSLGPYQVLEAIGTGGMGEVYRARDRELGREVAIKVLPAAFTADRERLARFEREARVLASLNHPNVGAIYGLEHMEGRRALVLELVEGDTLADRIAKERPGLAISDALTIGRQIADALEAAHEKGIVHRDLKPANIKVTPTGSVKVLDFGLAKADAGVAQGFSPADASKSPTLMVSGTRDGVLLGTAAYMSPEQARGQVVDKRADIWAFGCVLYEMFTGRTAFGGDTVSDHIAAILERDPDWSALPATLPTAVQRLLRRCLEKDPKRRLHDIADAGLEIDEARADPRPSPVPAISRRRRRSLWLAAAAVVAAVVGGYLAAARIATSPLPEFKRLTFRRQMVFSARFASGGRAIVYGARLDGRTTRTRLPSIRR